MTEDKIIDLENINGIYVPTKSSTSEKKKSKHVHNHINQKIVYNIYENDRFSSLNELLYGFNEGLRLMNKFIKIIR